MAAGSSFGRKVKLLGCSPTGGHPSVACSTSSGSGQPIASARQSTAATCSGGGWYSPRTCAAAHERYSSLQPDSAPSASRSWLRRCRGSSLTSVRCSHSHSQARRLSCDRRGSATKLAGVLLRVSASDLLADLADLSDLRRGGATRRRYQALVAKSHCDLVGRGSQVPSEEAYDVFQFTYTRSVVNELG